MTETPLLPLTHAPADDGVVSVPLAGGQVHVNRLTGAWCLTARAPDPEIARALSALVLHPLVTPVAFGHPQWLDLSVYVTRRCNLACTYCYASARCNADPSQTDLPLARYEAVLRRLLTLGPKGVNVILKGGEPLLRLEALAEFAACTRAAVAEQGISARLRVQCNGTLLDDAALAFLQRHDIGVGLSLDGPEDRHERQRPAVDGEPSFARAYAALVRARAAGIEPFVVMVATDAPGVQVLGEFAQAERLRRFRLNIVRQSGRGRGRAGEAVRSETGQAALAQAHVAVLGRIAAHNRAHPDARVTEVNGVDKVRELLAARPMSQGRALNYCYGMASQLAINESGDLYICQFYTHDQSTRVATFDALMAAADVRALLLSGCAVGRFLTTYDPAELAPCRSCFARQFCRGGCICAAGITATPSGAADGLCGYHQEMYRGLWQLELTTPGTLGDLLGGELPREGLSPLNQVPGVVLAVGQRVGP